VLAADFHLAGKRAIVTDKYARACHKPGRAGHLVAVDGNYPSSATKTGTQSGYRSVATDINT